ncbi:MAG TPA: glutathione S-transferase N-terminal domain-containing protein, partial [Pseudomonadales bacterium]|nr:glutathione S-transferase N-terminal domain-containing protein [Pseudomonadales bacterium]
MIDLYTWSTPNGRKISIALEELGVDYRAHAVDIGKGEQFAPAFAAISPNNKIPVIVDDGRALMESGAILVYLADKYGRLGGRDRWTTLEWLMLQMASIGPVLGQTHHFVKFNPGKAPYAEERFKTEAARLYGVLDARLRDHEYLADDYSIADI